MHYYIQMDGLDTLKNVENDFEGNKWKPEHVNKMLQLNIHYTSYNTLYSTAYITLYILIILKIS